MNTPENEWREDFRKQFDELKLKPLKNSMQNLERELIVNYIQNLLTDIALIKGERRRIVEQIREEERAHLVERIESLRRPEDLHDIEWQSMTNEQIKDRRFIRSCMNQALDQAIDIVKGNK